ncbi:hypothetical protein BJX70DRAFT_55268 [Aspergillus crustosus]
MSAVRQRDQDLLEIRDTRFAHYLIQAQAIICIGGIPGVFHILIRHRPDEQLARDSLFEMSDRAETLFNMPRSLSNHSAVPYSQVYEDGEDCGEAQEVVST